MILCMWHWGGNVNHTHMWRSEDHRWSLVELVLPPHPYVDPRTQVSRLVQQVLCLLHHLSSSSSKLRKRGNFQKVYMTFKETTKGFSSSQSWPQKSLFPSSPARFAHLRGIGKCSRGNGGLRHADQHSLFSKLQVDVMVRIYTEGYFFSSLSYWRIAMNLRSAWAT